MSRVWTDQTTTTADAKPGAHRGAPPPWLAAPSQKESRGRRIVVITGWVALGLLFGLLLGSIAAQTGPQPINSPNTTPDSAWPTPPAPEPAPAVPLHPATEEATEPEGITEGLWIVGEEIEPGTYVTDGPAPGLVRSCYWARLSGTSGELGDIIANHIGTGRMTVTVKPGDVAFESRGCQPWTRR